MRQKRALFSINFLNCSSFSLFMIINKEEFIKSQRKFTNTLKQDVFIYPTDTIYGLGCDATNEKLVQKIRDIKKSNMQPFSIIAPSKQWILDNCIVGEKEKPYVERLGQYIEINGQEHRFTLLLKLKNKNAVAKNINQGLDIIGVRIPNNWFSEIVKKLGIPIVTTSANSTGMDFMTSTEDLDPNIKNSVNLIIYEGEKKGRPSTIINLTEDYQIKHR